MSTVFLARDERFSEVTRTRTIEVMRASDDPTVRELQPLPSGEKRHFSPHYVIQPSPRSTAPSSNGVAVVSCSNSYPEKTSSVTSHAPVNPLSSHSSSTDRSSYPMVFRVSILNNHN